ncbi:ABC transporter substrate-binding protein [Paenibacillus helianthi]|uniref:ABC transporter substrate-binding protein n=1 Tax=Paenibacillus helianthi TaxID=1349432 RepID=A0ABX3EQ18_9BACL|nr:MULTISPECIES: extracellular solute-binding protein [Paenibacillus]OKP67874.1 ABC transporter substrate-binding protein [Paenibacillus sp. P3E]OKP86186.1 ABC transporter substrate-binding protein [Paenibacillus helianthi]OKP90752.1 ABC transporter substrate-binding protein [Paenibacillus sp. P32E]
MKRKFAFVIATVCTLIIAGCGNGGNNNSASNGNAVNSGTKTAAPAATAAPAKNVTIKMFQFKVEIAEQLNALAEQYEKETGVKVEVETHGGGEDYGALLKAEIASGSEPEIFNNGGYTALVPYMDRATDLSNEPWAANLIPTSKTPATVDGKLYGMPMNVEGYGLIYNKDLFTKAGITEEPKTLPQLKDAVAKLKAAGITPFEATNEWWSMGIHLVNVGLAHQPDPKKFIEDVKAGKATIKGNPVFEQWLNLVDVIFDNAQDNKMTTDYATQVAEFASGKAAMMLQGNWTQGDIDKINPAMNLGLLPLPISDKEGTILVGVPNNYVVNSKSAHPEEAKAFLNWLVTSETGKKYLTKEFKFIPAETNVEADAADIGQVAVAVQKQSATALGWNWDMFPDGVTQGFGAAMQEYLGGQLNHDQLLEKLDKAVQDIVKQ